jgi:EAL domain-containing protein (putative c-di-GMP-specific phosphodiesterase class I)
MIHDLTWIVIEECFRQKKAWESEGLFTRISFNLSAKVLGEENFLSDMQNMIDKHSIVPKDQFAIEVTESAILESLDESSSRFEKLRQMGFSLALDDFGTGYSSLKYLMTLPVEVLKIDRDFIKVIETETTEVPFLRNIIRLAHEIGVKVISEGVEEEFQKRRLEEYGTDFIQGFFFSRPMPAEKIPAFFRAHQEKTKGD